MDAEELHSDLRRLIAFREAFDRMKHPVARERRAQAILVSAIRLARDICGDDLLQTAYGSADPANRPHALRALSARLEIAACLFMNQEQGEFSLGALAEDVASVALGDNTSVLRSLPGRRTAVRVMRAKFDAVRWDSYLEGLGVPAAERHAAISGAFVQEWDTMSRWRAAISEAWGKEGVERRLWLDKFDGQRSLRRWSMRPGESWQDALKRSGKAFGEATRLHAAT